MPYFQSLRVKNAQAFLISGDDEVPAEVLYVRNDASSDFFRGKIADNVALFRDKPKTVLGSYGFFASWIQKLRTGSPSVLRSL